MVLRRVRAMLPRSVLMPVSISRAVFGHKNTNSPMLRSQWGHDAFYRVPGPWRIAAARSLCLPVDMWISAQAIESKGSFPGARRAGSSGREAKGEPHGAAAKPRASHRRGERHSRACGGNGPRARGRVLSRLAGDLVLVAASIAGAGAGRLSRARARHAR